MTSAAWMFHNPTRISFGPGKRAELAAHLTGGATLVVTTARGRRQFEADPILGPLAAGTDLVWLDKVLPNPGLAETEADIARLAGRTFERVVAFGGGSALDAGKAVSVALGTGGAHTLAALIADPRLMAGSNAIPLIALPTTSGTGAEVTPFATIWDNANRKKLSLAGPAAQPVVAIVDPELTYGLPAEATFSTGLDALNQALESAWNRNASTVTLRLATSAIATAIAALLRLNADLGDVGARQALAEASLLAGLCISQTRTAICHSMSYPITAHFDVAHGTACAFTMSAVAELCRERAPDRFESIATLSGFADGAALVRQIVDLTETLGVRRIVRRQIDGLDRLLALQGEMVTPGRADNFVVPIDSLTLGAILRRSYGG